MTEQWKPVLGYEGVYEVSDHGSVRSLPRLDAAGRKRSGKTLSPGGHPQGYLVVSLCKDGTQTTHRVHRLVATAFHGPPTEEQPLVRHLNGDASDNRSVNLAWGTSSENSFDAVRHGTHFTGSKTHCSHGHELTPENVYRWRGARYCKECSRLRGAAWRQRRVHNPVDGVW